MAGCSTCTKFLSIIFLAIELEHTTRNFDFDGPSMNRLDIELAQLNSELMKNNGEGKTARAELNFFESFNEAEKRKEILDLIDIFKQKNEEIKSIPVLSSPIAVPPPGFLEKLFGFGEYYKAQEKRVEIEAERKRYQEKLAFEIAKLDEKIKEGQALIRRYKSLDEYQLRAMVKMYECREEIFKGKIHSVSEKLENLRQAVGPLLENAECYRHQVRNYEKDLKSCQAYLEQLSAYYDMPAKRRKVHEACAEQFNGNGRPSEVAADIKKKLEAARRQLIKIEDRIEEEIKKMDIVVKRAFIDGNNICFRRNQYKDDFIGTQALEAVATALLKIGIEVTIVFDPYIGKGKDRMSFDRVQQNFEKEITLYQAPPDTTADLVLMMMARDEFDCVISNDKFADYAERSVVKEKRVFRAVITESVVSVPMLNLEVPLLNRV